MFFYSYLKCEKVGISPTGTLSGTAVATASESFAHANTVRNAVNQLGEKRRERRRKSGKKKR